MKQSFEKEYLMEELDLPWSCVDREMYDQGRWETHWRGVAEIDGQHWQFEWSQGSTEMQDVTPWEYDDEVEGTLVEKRSVTVERWVPVGE